VAFLDSTRDSPWYCPCCGDSEKLKNLWEFDRSIQEEMENNSNFWRAIKQGKKLIEMEKNIITEKQGEGKVDIDADLDHFRKKLETAQLDGNAAEISRVEKQISLLEDSVVIYRLSSAPERRAIMVDLKDMSPTDAAERLEEIKVAIEEKRLNG
jgi:hypothetical protein